MNELALFAGAGGGLLASRLLGWSTVAAVEIDPFCREVLLRRQRDGLLDDFPVWDDVRTFDGQPWVGLVHVISGGFPCQDVSVAGKGLGVRSGERSGLWREFARVIGEVRPHLAFIENSPELVSRGLDIVLNDLAAMGYDARWCVLGAGHLGGSHWRRRMFVLAYADGKLSEATGGRQEKDAAKAGEGRKTERRRGGRDGGNAVEVADPDGDRGPIRPAAAPLPQARGRRQDDRGAGRGDERRQPVPAEPREAGLRVCPAGLARGLREASERVWDESRLGRVSHGVPSRLDRIKALGNAQVPQVAAAAFLLLSEGLIE